MGVNWIAGVWGLAEATLFFFVPDIWLSIAGRKKLRTGLTACLCCLGGALIGGCILYVWGHLDLTGARHLVEKVPAVSQGMIERVRLEDGVRWDVDRRLSVRLRTAMTVGANRISRLAGGDVTHRVHTVSEREHVVAIGITFV